MKKKIFIYLYLFLFWSNVSYAECISGNCLNGTGTKTFSNGSKYEGEFKDGKFDGYGIFIFQDGEKHEGGI